jgi:transposase
MKKREFDYCVGIDTSKETLDLVLIDIEALNQIKHLCIPNNSKGMKTIESWLNEQEIKINQVLFCTEFTGIYNAPLQKYMEKRKAFLWMEMPVRIIRSMGLQRGKSDKVDAKRIAMYAARHQQDRVRWAPSSKEKEAIVDLIALRNRLINAKNILSVPAKELESVGEKSRSSKIKKHCSKSIRSLELEIEQVEEEIRTLINTEPSMKKNIDLMITIPGVGMWTALQMVCVTDNFQRLKNARQLASFCGVAPFEHTSGTSIRGKSRVHHMSNKPLKTLLTLGARSIINSKNEMSVYYQRKVAEGKSKMSVINAIRNKLIHRIIAVIDRQEPYVNNYQLAS